MSVNPAPESTSEPQGTGEPVGEPAAPPAPLDPTPTADGPTSAAGGPTPTIGGTGYAPAPPAGVRRSRLGGLWLMAVLGAIILVLLLVFILQNGQRIEIHLYGAHWNAPLGVALLMAAALGVLLVVVPGGGRILQLKRTARRLHRRSLDLTDQLRQASAPPQTDGPTTTPQP